MMWNESFGSEPQKIHKNSSVRRKLSKPEDVSLFLQQQPGSTSGSFICVPSWIFHRSSNPQIHYSTTVFCTDICSSLCERQHISAFSSHSLPKEGGFLAAVLSQRPGEASLDCGKHQPGVQIKLPDVEPHSNQVHIDLCSKLCTCVQFFLAVFK